jgi:ribosomal-protein-alanine N-acetyltransferase
MTPWTIRLASVKDVDDILAIETAQFPEPWTRGMLLEELRNTETRRYTVAVENKHVVGYLGLMFVMDDEMHINTIGVLPGNERRGIANSLMIEGISAATARGAERATLEVAVSNNPAQDLYRKFGFAPVGIRRNYYEKSGEDALIMWANFDRPKESSNFARCD